METVNGKLINQEFSQFDELTQKTEQINQRCEYLESQLTAISTPEYKQYLQKLEQKINLLEEVTSRQGKHLSFFKIGSVISLLSLWFILSMNNQPQNDKNQLQQPTNSMQLIQP